jgi:transcriptional antiterminator RfaH
MRGTSHAPLEPLFPRYLFIRFEAAGTGWSALRSTRGVSRLVSFGIEPAQVDDGLIEHLRATEKSLTEQPLFAVGEPVQVILGPFAGIEGVYLMADGESRAMVLVELLSKSAKLPVPLAYLKRVDG